jgi:hypothetical protein
MKRRTVGLLAVVAGVVGIAIAAWGSGTGYADHLGHTHPPDGQEFFSDVATCRGATSNIFPNGLQNATVFPALTCNAETLTTSTTVSQASDIVIHRGDRLALPFLYTDSAFGVTADAGITNNTIVGDVRSRINVACDGTDDFFIDESSTTYNAFSGAGVNPEPFREQTTAFNSTSGDAGRSEDFLNSVLPPFAKVVRYRADINFVTLGGSPFPLTNSVSLNAVVMDFPSGNARISATLLGGDPSAPSAQYDLCLDSPQTSASNFTTAAGLSNPTTGGTYAVFTTHLSAAGIRDESQQHFAVITSCKNIGGAGVDADNDCWDDSVDTNTGNRDQDGDTLLDGLEAILGTNPNNADTDGDGRTDLEEIVGPANLLTDPTVADTDGDTLLDAGLNLDCNGDGVPDTVVENSNSGSGRNRLIVRIAYCKEDGTNVLNTPGAKGGRPFGNPGAASKDNCPNIANPGQANSANTDIDLGGTPGDSNDRFNGTADISHPNGRFTGDACVGDADNDGIPDVVENGTVHFDATGGTSGNAFCNTAGLGVLIALDDKNRDTDGDGTDDGTECQLKTNPADATSKPATVPLAAEKFFRMNGLSLPDGSVVGDIQDGEVFNSSAQVKKGLSPASRDSDGDGCADAVEAADVDGDGDVDAGDRLSVARAVLNVSPLTHPLSADELRTADFDGNGVVQGAGGAADRLGVARVSLSNSLAAILDYQVLCIVSQNGYLPN